MASKYSERLRQTEVLEFASVEDFQASLIDISDENGLISVENDSYVSIHEIGEYFNAFVCMTSEQDHPGLVGGALRGWLSKQKKIERGEVDRKLILPSIFHENFGRLARIEQLRDPSELKHKLFEKE